MCDSPSGFLGFFGELVFAYAANRAYPIFGDILECCSWLDTTVGVSYCWVIHITADFTNILFHYCIV